MGHRNGPEERRTSTAAGSQARLIVNDAFYMGGGREGGTKDPPGKITKFRGPGIPLIASIFLVWGGSRMDRLIAPLRNPSLETFILLSVSVFVRPEICDFTFGGSRKAGLIRFSSN